ncbi:MAG: di-trans,poly-cis-decaprenylcistransferase [Oscillospiraceae bacterium]|nr:di-trans,poly-cis-decaprenylcistransferase [Oscillospiraceae bacterium]
MSQSVEKDCLPKHVAIIMDGNGRWAKQRGLPRSEGHKQGAKVFKRICEYAADRGIKYLTFYAFSTENWSRPEEEVRNIMNLFRDYLYEAEERKVENEEKGMRLRYIGDREGLPEDIIYLVNQLEKQSADKVKTTVNLAVNYGGRNELLKACKAIAQECADGVRTPESITEDDISSKLYTAGQPDPDLIIRPSGEFRLSNFLIWQAAYSEFLYSNILWPDYTEDDFDAALEEYARRNRRFGGV